MNFSKYEYIVLNLTDIDSQFKTYKKIIDLGIKISNGCKMVDETECLWYYQISTNEFSKAYKDSIDENTDLICNTIADFFKKINLIRPLKEIEIGDYTGMIYKNHIKVGCQTISKKQIEEILEIMNK